MRKPSPISISSPRETITSRPSASAASASRTAAALLFTTSAASAPVSRRRIPATWSCRDPRDAGRQVELEVRVAARGLAHVVERSFGERRTTEVRVDDHAGRVEHAPERRRSRSLELLDEARPEVTRVDSRLDLLPRSREHLTGGLDGQRIAGIAGQLVDRRQVSKAHGRSVSGAATFDLVTELATRVVPRTWPRVSSVLVAALLAAAVMPYLRAVPYRGEALPGTSVAGVDLAGVGHAEAVSSVQAAVLPSLARDVELRAGGTRLTVRPSELYASNAAATADAVLAASRRTEPDRVAALVGLREVEVSPVLVERPKAIAAFLARVRSVGGESATAATVGMDGVEPTVTPSREGLRLDSARLLSDVRSAAFDERAVTAHFVPAAARYSTADAERAAELARDLIGTPVYVFFDGRPLRTLATHELARLVEFEKRSGDFLVGFDQDAARARARPRDRRTRAARSRRTVRGRRRQGSGRGRSARHRAGRGRRGRCGDRRRVLARPPHRRSERWRDPGRRSRRISSTRSGSRARSRRSRPTWASRRRTGSGTCS